MMDHALLPADTRVSRPGRDLADVTIVITVFNQSAWLGQAIESALEQTYPHVAVIVVDDGSTDGADAVCRRYPAVRYWYQENAGLSAARNAGLGLVTSRLVSFLDADDVLRPDGIAAGVAALEDHEDWAFVYGAYREVRPDRTLLWEARTQPQDACYRALLTGNRIGMHGAVLYRRQALLDAGGFDVRLPCCEDYDLYLRLAQDHAFGCHGEVVAEYRQHDENMSRNLARMLEASLAVLERQRSRVAGRPEDEKALRAGLAAQSRRYAVPLIKRALRDLAVPGRRLSALAQLRRVRALAPAVFVASLRGLVRRSAARAERRLPSSLRARLRRVLRRRPPDIAPGRVRFGDLRRLVPIDSEFGFARGTPVDRFYIERFLARNADKVRGHVLEIGDAAYTRRYGGDKVSRSDVLHVSASAPGVTIVGDLTNADHIADATFDAIILTQTLHLIFDMQRAVATLSRILKPSGVLLLTVPGLSQVDRGEWSRTWFWSLTEAALRGLLGSSGEWSSLQVEADGNVLSAISFLHGLAAEELTRPELEARDPAYPVIVAAVAVKAPAP